MSEGPTTDNEAVDLRAFGRDERGIVIAWLARLAVGLVILGVVLYDAGSIVVNVISLDGTADEVAVEVSTNLATGAEPVPNRKCTRRFADPACQVVYRVARAKGVRVVSAHFDQEGVFHVELRRTADTLIVRHIGAIEDWATATASAQAATN